jgi:hypothetical protein
MGNEICLNVQLWILELSKVQDGGDLDIRAVLPAGMKDRRRGRSRKHPTPEMLVPFPAQGRRRRSREVNHRHG